MFKNKSYSLVLLSFLILLLLLSYNTHSHYQEIKYNEKKSQEVKIKCLDGYFKGSDNQRVCDQINFDDETPNYDMYSVFYTIIVSGLADNVYFIVFFFVAVPALFSICNCFKNKTIINELTRSSYKNTFKKLFKKSYVSSFILPTIIIIALIISFSFAKSFDYSISTSNSIIGWSENDLKFPGLFFSLYLLNIFIHSVLYVNICLIIARKNHNYLVALILSFLTFIAIELFLEIAIGGILLWHILKSDLGLYFNIMNMFSFNTGAGLLMPMVIPFALMVITFIVIYFLYRNKENLIIDCEMNN